MKHLLSILSFALAASAYLHAADNADILDDAIYSSNYAFKISAPKGWEYTTTRERQSSIRPVGRPIDNRDNALVMYARSADKKHPHPAVTQFEKDAIVIYARSADKKELRVSSISELNSLDLKGIQEQHPTAKSEMIGAVKSAHGHELSLYSFTGGGYSEIVAYAEHAKTITALVLSADTDEQLKSARAAFDEFLSSYVFLTDTPNAPKHPANSKKKQKRAK